MNETEKPVADSLSSIRGILTKDGVEISERGYVDSLSSKGYGLVQGKELVLAPHEALFLSDREILEIEDEKHRRIDFQTLLQRLKKIDENAWAKYLIYRDLRSRGYVVREGFGLGVDFRVYERGDYNKDTAKKLVLGIQEGKPISIMDLTAGLKQAQSMKKELILAVMNRRGEIIYYSVSQLALK